MSLQLHKQPLTSVYSVSSGWSSCIIGSKSTTHVHNYCEACLARKQCRSVLVYLVYEKLCDRSLVDYAAFAVMDHVSHCTIGRTIPCCLTCTDLESQREACKSAGLQLQSRGQQVKELATISEPHARYSHKITIMPALS